jgi:hypothetical protein
MNTENVIRIFAGSVILASLALGADASPVFHNRHWMWLAAFVGANLFQFGFSGFCPLELILKKLGVKTCAQATEARLRAQH